MGLRDSLRLLWGRIAVGRYRRLEIGEYGKKMGADLIAVGTHHRGRLHRLPKRSTAEFPAREATSSILMVRAG
jgi:nucleotide-binding universal stress UspA family protein